MELPELRPSEHLREVRYEIRGDLAHRAQELEQQGNEIIKLNIGNPGAFGFRMPEQMRRALVANLADSDGYCHQKGIFPAREAVKMAMEETCRTELTAEQVFIGAGVSELIMLAMRALINPGDEVLIPAPDYPLWTASVVIHGGRAVHYPCRPERAFVPDPAELEALLTERTKAIVLINPNNPTGAVYDRAVLEAIVGMAEARGITLFADEIYDRMTYDGAEHVPLRSLVRHTLLGTFGGLSKVYRACGLRVGWLVFSGELEHATEYMRAVELLASLRLCSNVLGQWAVQTALGGHQSILDICAPGGRLHETRRLVMDRIGQSPYLKAEAPAGAMYVFVRVDQAVLPSFDDQDFALELLERKHLLIAPGQSFNYPRNDHFRITLLPQPELIPEIFDRIDDLLDEYRAQHRRATGA